MLFPKTNLTRFEPSNLRTFEPSNPRPVAAFTLIEVLVATAGMAIIVLMLGGVFNQASSSWDSGYARAEEGMAVRAVIGSLTRDLATAVDGRRYNRSWKYPIKEEPGKETTTLTFYHLKDDGSGSVEEVTYKGGSTVERNKKPIYSGASSDGQGAEFKFYVGPVSGQTQDSSTYRKYEDGPFKRGVSNGNEGTKSPPVLWTVPYVKVRCELTRKGWLSGIEVRSYGKDGKKSDDDIVVR